MWIQYTNFDSDGTPVTQRDVVTIDGDRYEIDVMGTGTANVPDHVGEYLINSPESAVTEAQSDE